MFSWVEINVFSLISSSSILSHFCPSYFFFDAFPFFHHYCPQVPTPPVLKTLTVWVDERIGGEGSFLQLSMTMVGWPFLRHLLVTKITTKCHSAESCWSLELIWPMFACSQKVVSKLCRLGRCHSNRMPAPPWWFNWKSGRAIYIMESHGGDKLVQCLSKTNSVELRALGSLNPR